jgi:hypothetical protein
MGLLMILTLSVIALTIIGFAIGARMAARDHLCCFSPKVETDIEFQPTRQSG